MKNYKKLGTISLLLLTLCNFAQATDIKQLTIDASSFSCIRDMTKVRGLYVSNLLGDIETTLAIANSATGGVYPAGSVVQLVPTEAMVKHPKGFNTVTNDWEFFELKVAKDGSTISNRGFADVVNRFGGNCFGCHLKAKHQWDLVCETGHGCDPLPLTKDMLTAIQKTDPRCTTNETLTNEELAAFAQLRQMMAGAKAKKATSEQK